MPSWKIHHRLLGGFTLVIVLLIGLSAYSVRVTGGIDAALSANSQQNSVIQRAAIDFRGSVHDRAIALRDVVIAPDAAALQQELQHIERLAQAYARANTQLQAVLHSQANTVPPEVATLLAAIERDEVASRTTTANLLAQLQQGDQAGAQALLWAQIKPLYAQWLASINRLIDFEESRIRVNNAQANGAANEFGQAMLLITALAVALSVVAALLLARHITRALGAEPQEVRDVMRALQDGQLTVHVKVRPGDRSSVMAAVADMQQRLHELVSAVHSNIARLRTTGSEITDGNVRLGERTVHTSDNLHRTSDAMQALTVAVQHSAEHARQAEALAGDALGAASRGGTVMQQVVGTMQDIAASSHRIEEIIGVIDGIAFQTNILALNAAVEAARAGEQGRGFAVVAAEVRALAQRSAEAAHQIKALIASSVERVTAGNDLVEQAGSAMHDIVAHVQQVHQIIEAMGQATHTQSQDILQVNQAVSDLEGMTVQNATLVEASTATAGELEAQAANLAALAAAFTVHDHAAVLRLQSTAAR